MKETISLYNHFHNGDVFYSRIIIQPLLEKFNIRYHHNNKSPLMEDIKGLEEIVGIPHNFDLHGTNFQEKIINTWIGQANFRYLGATEYIGCSFENYVFLAKEICLNYGIDLSTENISQYLPSVNYNELKNTDKINSTMSSLKNKYKKIILISNGHVASCQSQNFDFTQHIINLSQNNQDCFFITTQDMGFVKENIMYTYQITQSIPDLTLISYISSFSDIIVGRASGPFCFSHTIDNMNNFSKIFISFSNTSGEGKFYSNSNCKCIWSNDYSPNNIYTTIENEIKST